MDIVTATFVQIARWAKNAKNVLTWTMYTKRTIEMTVTLEMECSSVRTPPFRSSPGNATMGKIQRSKQQTNCPRQIWQPT